MALAIDTIDGRGLSNVVHRELTAVRRARYRCICCLLHGKSRLTSCTLLTRHSAPVLKVGMPCGLRSLQNQTGL